MSKKLQKVLTCLICAFLLVGCANDPSDSVKNKEEFDATKLPYYEEDINGLEYSYTEDERIRPFWMGNVIYNEQLMVVEKDGVTEGHLLYDAVKVISVRDAQLKTEYREGTDYTVTGNTIKLPQGSKIPVFKDKWSSGTDVPSAYPEGNAGTGYEMIGDSIYTETSLIWGNYIHVTYAYDPSKVDRTAVKTFGDELYGLKEMLAAKQDINMVVFGDSISEGHSSSGLWKHEPFSPQYAELVRYGLSKFGGVNVTLRNISLGGMDSKWAAEPEQIATLQAAKPDLLILAFGTNDTVLNIEGGKYEKNIRAVIDAARMANQNCQIVLVSPFPSREESKSAAMHLQISDILGSIVKSQDYLDIMLVDMYKFCKPMLDIKNYYEISGNNQNHPNDFIHRCYAMNILSGLFDFKNV